MPYCDGSDLRKIYYENLGKLSEFETIKVGFQLVQALKYLKDQKIAHRHLSPECIFYKD